MPFFSINPMFFLKETAPVVVQSAPLTQSSYLSRAIVSISEMGYLKSAAALGGLSLTLVAGIAIGRNKKAREFLNENKGFLFKASILAGLGYLSFRYGNWDRQSVGVASTALLSAAATVGIFNQFKINIADEKPIQIAEFTENWVKMAREGRQPHEGSLVLEREKEIKELIVYLSIRGKNNVLLLGPAGSGKSAIAFEFARRIAVGEVPEHLKKCEVLSLSVCSLKAGCKFYGEIEKKINGLLTYLKANPQTILFVDEVHLLRENFNSVQDSHNIADLLKPALAEGLRCIGATTKEEHQKLIEPNPAFDRRFHQVMIEPMTSKQTLDMLMRCKKQRFEDIYNVEINEDAVGKIVELMATIPHRYFPDKAIDLLSKVCINVQVEGEKIVKVSDVEKAFQTLQGKSQTLTYYT